MNDYRAIAELIKLMIKDGIETETIVEVVIDMMKN